MIAEYDSTVCACVELVDVNDGNCCNNPSDLSRSSSAPCCLSFSLPSSLELRGMVSYGALKAVCKAGDDVARQRTALKRLFGSFVKCDKNVVRTQVSRRCHVDVRRCPPVSSRHPALMIAQTCLDTHGMARDTSSSLVFSGTTLASESHVRSADRLTALSPHSYRPLIASHRIASYRMTWRKVAALVSRLEKSVPKAAAKAEANLPASIKGLKIEKAPEPLREVLAAKTAEKGTVEEEKSLNRNASMHMGGYVNGDQKGTLSGPARAGSPPPPAPPTLGTLPSGEEDQDPLDTSAGAASPMGGDEGKCAEEVLADVQASEEIFGKAFRGGPKAAAGLAARLQREVREHLDGLGLLVCPRVLLVRRCDVM